MSIASPPEERRPHVLGDLGLVIEEVGDELHATADVLPTMWTPGTTSLRLSILATWADTLLGLIAVRALAPRVPVTLELDVHVPENIVDATTVRCVGRLAKEGSSVLVSTIAFLVDDRRVGFGHSMFMAAPDPRLTMPTGSWALDRFHARRGTLEQPFAERTGCVRTGPGSATIACEPHVLNQSKVLNGGLLTIVVEEAVLSAAPPGQTIASMQVRFLRPVRQGPAVAQATVHAGLGEVEVHDAGTGALAVLATTRSASR